jgi:hypothetical protein
MFLLRTHILGSAAHWHCANCNCITCHEKAYTNMRCQEHTVQVGLQSRNIQKK